MRVPGVAGIVFGLALLCAVACARAPRMDIAEKSPRAAALSDSESHCAARAMRLALLGMPAETWGDYRQLRLPNHPPLQSFPRLTAPAFVEPCAGAWWVPVVFDASVEVIQPKKGERWASFHEAHPADFLAFWLEAADGDGGSPLDRLHPVAPSQVFRVIDLKQGDQPWVETRKDEQEPIVLRLPASAGFKPAYYWLRIVPRFPEARGTSSLARAVAEGDLLNVLAQLGDQEKIAVPKDLGDAFDCRYAALNFGLNSCTHPYKHWWSPMRELSKRLGSSSDKSQRRMMRALRTIYDDDRSPAGVLLQAEGTRYEPFSFAIGGDVQNSQSTAGLRRFLQVADQRLRLERDKDDTVEALDEALAAHGTKRVEFVLFAGDLADNEAGSNLPKMALNFFGLWPPRSSYAKENPTLAKELRRFQRPFVGVPGNHDGMVGYPGLLNSLLSGLCFNVRILDKANDYVPVLFRPPLPESLRGVPRYDGLAEWRYAFGPTSYAFQFRDHTFVGLNSFHLRQRERSGSGSVIFNWGGGVTQDDVDWVAEVLEKLPGSYALEPGRQMLYMHHDPRAATPLKSTGELDAYGIYDDIDNLASFVTFGHFGLGHSPRWDAYFPVVTPLAHHGSRLIDDFLAGRGRQQEEWMKRSYDWLDPDSGGNYHAKELIDVVNDKLYVAGQGGISNLFFAHNDVPLGPSPWVHAADGGAVFPELRAGDWSEGREYHHHFKQPPLPFIKALLHPLLKVRNDEPPDWAKAMRPREGNADVVRLDDLSYPNSPHGFHLVTVVPEKCGCARPHPAEVFIRWVPLQSQVKP